jgi:hypothetical protein
VFSTTRSSTRAVFAASGSVTVTASSVGDVAEGSGGTELGRTVKIGVPVDTRDVTNTLPPNTDWSAIRSGLTPTASVITPDLVFTASRPATSLPSAVEASSTAAGPRSATSDASTSALGAIA